jgi:hypothetical protein
MGFGYSVADFVTLGELAWKVYKSCKDAPKSFIDLSHEVLSLSAVLKEAEETFSGQTLPLKTQERLKTVGDGCRIVLEDLQSLIDRYESLGKQTKRTWDRLGWCSNDTVKLRSRLTSNTVLLTAFIRLVHAYATSKWSHGYVFEYIHVDNKCHSTSQVVVERQLNQFLRDGMHEGSIVTTQTGESLSIDEKQIWRTIRKELGDIGITVAAFDANREFIMDWFKAAIASGAFEEQTFEDTSSSRPCEDNLSQSLGHPEYPIAGQSVTEVFIPPQKTIQKASARRGRFPRVATLIAKVFRYIQVLTNAARKGDEVKLKLLLKREEYNRLIPSSVANEHRHRYHIHELSPTIFLPRAADIGPDVRSALSFLYSAPTLL